MNFGSALTELRPIPTVNEAMIAAMRRIARFMAGYHETSLVDIYGVARLDC